jgi:hypothetical protein
VIAIRQCKAWATWTVETLLTINRVAMTFVLRSFRYNVFVTLHTLQLKFIFTWYPPPPPRDAQQPKSDLDHLIVEVSRSHTHTHTHPVGLLCTSDQLGAEAATYTTHNTYKRRASISSAGIRTRGPSNRTCALHRTPSGIRFFLLLGVYFD